jgi:DtxR family Mn-dependent transcriptional regulator
MRQATIDDYLKAMYVIRENQQDIKKGINSIDVANTLKVKKSSVSSIVKKLSKLGYIKSEPYSAIFFTIKGITEAKKITHNHRVIEYFLKETLKCDTNIIHDEAHKLEHAFSDYSMRKLDSFLGNPKISPHGKRIH